MKPDRRIFLIAVILLNSVKTGQAQVPQIGQSSVKSELAVLLPGKAPNYLTTSDGNKLDSVIIGPWITDSIKYSIMNKSVFGYDPFGNNTSIYEYEKTNPAAGAWKSTWKLSQTYDALNNLIQFTGYEWKNKWVLNEKIEYSYEVNKKKESMYGWDLSTGRWIELQKIVNFFDFNGNSILYEYSKWDASLNQWDIYTTKNEITYNDQGSILISITSIYNSSSHQWLKQFKGEYVYNSSNIQTSHIGYVWNLSSENWDPASKLEWSINSSETTWISSNWDLTSGKWVPSQMDYTHYTDGKTDLNVTSYWNRSDSQWVFYEKFEWNYQDNGNKQEISGYIFDVVTYKWIENIKSYRYYSDHHSVIPGNYINVYPNPSTEFVVFSLKEISDSARIELFSLQGKKVMDQKLPANGLIQINQLGGGIYIYRLSNEQKIYRGKFAKTGEMK